MLQYFDAKAQHPGALVFFRMGDFYELFFDDALTAAAALGIAQTFRGTYDGAPIPMAGVPVHTAEAYLAKLICAGFKVAVCEQMEDPATARKRGSKAVVRREVVRVLTPGTLTEDGLLEARGANRLAAINIRGGEAAAISVDLSTGEVDCLHVEAAGLMAVLAAWRPAEVLVPDRLLSDPNFGEALKNVGGFVQPMPSALAEAVAAEARVCRLYDVATLDGFGGLSPVEVSALGLIASHLEVTQGGRMPPLRAPRRAGAHDEMIIDPATRASLEIDRTLRGDRDGSLLSVIDRTVTAAGSRLLGARLTRPRLDIAEIERRFDALGWLLERASLRRSVREDLQRIGDMARSVTRLALGRGGPRDLGVLRDSQAPGLRLSDTLRGDSEALGSRPAELDQILLDLEGFRIGPLADLLQTLQRDLSADLPVQARDGGFIAPGANDALDTIRALRDDSRKVIVDLELQLVQTSGLPLKIRHNAVIGYFVEVTASRAEPLLRPPLNGQFIHRQTMANQMRFTTAELADLDAQIAQAADQALAIELSTFETWRGLVSALAGQVQAIADALARLDVYAGLASWAEEVNGVRPHIDTSGVFHVVAGRHPVVEQAVRRTGEPYTSNDCRLDAQGQSGPRLALVTGPNMAGKSTFLRQNALLAVLAQSGAFVPAIACHMGLVDRLFSRVGAGDDLARGRSTFMTEMVETAVILTQATPRSMVILDEVGRGTSTWDGLAIAWACTEALHDVNRCRVLFATHFHELAKLESRLAHVSNLSLRARDWKGGLIFLHEVVAGPADRSYGVQVAKLAGLPTSVIVRARDILKRLEKQGTDQGGLEDLPLFANRVDLAEPETPALDYLRSLDVDSMSPRDALDALYRLKGLV